MLRRYQSKLQPGDIIEVHGWVMLDKLGPGTYRVETSDWNGIAMYTFTRPKGKKVIIRHFVDNVDPWVKTADDADLNKIVVLTPTKGM